LPLAAATFLRLLLRGSVWEPGRLSGDKEEGKDCACSAGFRGRVLKNMANPSHHKFDSATSYSIHTCSMLRGSTLKKKKMFPYYFFYFKGGQYMCGAPERLTAFGARTFLVLSQQLWIRKYSW
jgi:hypothetical protein